jgi:hypothetical protein
VRRNGEKLGKPIEEMIKMGNKDLIFSNRKINTASQFK